MRHEDYEELRKLALAIMDKEIIIGRIGSIIKYLGLLMLVPLGFALWQGGWRPSLFLLQTWVAPCAITTLFGLVLERRLGTTKGLIKRREGFAVVGLGWLAVAFFGSLPYIFSATLGPFDAFFEMMAGFTTTGATVMQQIEQVDRSILLWRSFTQWIGGLGVIILFIAILPTFGLAGSQLFDREFPGPITERIRPRVQMTARLLWTIYVVLTVMEILALLYLAGMTPFHAVCTSFCTMPTGGFSTLTANIGGYMNPTAEYIIMLFMFLGGMNFILHYSLPRDPRRVIADKEFRLYCFFILTATTIIAADLYILGYYTSLLEAFRYGGFQVISFMTTTGFTTANFDAWSSLSKIILLSLMFIGGCGGSTGGAIKVIRIHILLKYVGQRIRQNLYPHAVFILKTGKRVIPDEVIQGITVFIFSYFLVFILCSIAMTAIGFDILSAISAVAATLGNVGPGFGLVAADYAAVPLIGKIILSFCMWIGRLELFTVFVLLSPTYWKS